MKQLFRALVHPDRAFAEEATFRVPRFMLLIALFLLFVVGSDLIISFYQNPYVLGVAIQDAERNASQFLSGPPGSNSNQQSGGAQQGPGGRTSRFQLQAAALPPAAIAVGAVAQSLIFIGIAYVAWFGITIFTQFLGGEEARTGNERHRASNYLVLIAWVPLALRRVLEGFVIQLQNPVAAWSAASVADYRRESGVSFGLASALPVDQLPPALSYLANSLTDPFFWWAGIVLMIGGRRIFHLSSRAAAIQTIFVFVVLFGFHMLFAASGGSPGF